MTLIKLGRYTTSFELSPMFNISEKIVKMLYSPGFIYGKAMERN